MDYTRERSNVFLKLMAAGVIGLITLGTPACNSGSVVSDSSEDKKTTVAQTEAPATPPPAASPVPTTPVGPVGQTSPEVAPASGPQEDPFVLKGEQKGNMMGGPGFTVTKAKPAPTPNPDPFPPRPTPEIVMKNGKIVQHWQAPAEAASVVNPFKDKPDAVKLGKLYYGQKCVDCHGRNGQGNGWMSRGLLRPPTNLASKVVQANTDGELFWKITKGKSPMPAHGIRFDDEQRWYIVTYLRTFNP